MLPNKTFKFKGDKSKGKKTSKKRLIILLCASAIGEKIPLKIIGKYANPRCFKYKKMNNIHYHANSNAWMKSEIFKFELLKWDSKLRTENRKILLLIDNCSSHPNINNILSNIKLYFIPPNTTSVLQPMDSGIIKNFKVNYRKNLLIQAIKSIDEKKDFKIDVYQAIQMILDSWHKVTVKTIKNCFLHAISLNSIEKEKEKIEIANSIKNIIDNELVDVLEWFDSKEIFNNYLNIDNEIDITGENNNDEIVIDNILENEPDINVKTKEIDIGEVLNAINLIKKFYFEQDYNNKLYTNILDIQNDVQKKYSKKKLRQTKITEFFKIK